MPGLIVACANAASEDALLTGITTTLPSGDPANEISEFPQYLSTQWTAMREKDLSLESLIDTLCVQPAKKAGLSESKGSIATGFDADLVIWNPEYTVTGTQPLLFGSIRQVIVAGRTVVKEGQRV